MTDRTFGVMHPHIHNDIAFDIADNWTQIVEALLPQGSSVVSYSFPVPLDTKHPGRMGTLRSGRMNYEFLGMVDRDLVTLSYRFTHIVKADIKNFYPSVYTHSLAWALHGKDHARAARNDYSLLGNRLDRLFQHANDGCTNGIPIGPAVSDVASELIAAAVDKDLTTRLKEKKLLFAAVRFKDDYRFLVRSEADGRTVIKAFQAALRQYNPEVSDDKTAMYMLPDGLFREWSSMYYAIHPKRRRSYSWKAFRELYLAVVRIDRACKGTGVIDRFLADIVTSQGGLKMCVGMQNLLKVLSMLLLLGRLRIKAFPKIVAIIEGVLTSRFGQQHRAEIVQYLAHYLKELAKDEERNKYLIAWIGYFFVSNGLMTAQRLARHCSDPITRSVFRSRRAVFPDATDFNIFVGCKLAGRKTSMLRHLEVFMPPPDI